MKTRVLLLISVIVIIPAINESFAEEEILILVENDIKKVYYTGENILSTSYDPLSVSVTFETDYDAILEINAPQVYKKGPGLFILKNGEETSSETRTDDCLLYNH